MVSSSSAQNLNQSYSGLFTKFIFLFFYSLESSVFMLYVYFFANLWLCTKSTFGWFFLIKFYSAPFTYLHLSWHYPILSHSVPLSYHYVLSYHCNTFKVGLWAIENRSSQLYIKIMKQLNSFVPSFLKCIN